MFTKIRAIYDILKEIENGGRGRERRRTMDIRLGDTLTMKKAHPCGSKQWLVLRVGMDFRLRCCGCGHEVMIPRSKVEKNIRSIEREDATC
jgi:hypothetical protein